MAANTHYEQAVEVLQDLGLKEYEAMCFVALVRLPKATAKDISEITDVPRTRVYDATRVLEAKGLAEIHHSNPREFRAVRLKEAIRILQDQYESMVVDLQQALEGLEPVEIENGTVAQEVWSLTGSEAIANRTQTIIEEATNEVVLVIGEDALLTDELFESINASPEEVAINVGALSESAKNQVEEAIPRAMVFVSGLEWLRSNGQPNDDTVVGRLLVVDRLTILVSSWQQGAGEEHAIFGRGFGNGLVVLARRMMATGQVPHGA